MEVSKNQKKILQMISNKIYRDTNRVISMDDLKSYFKGYILEDSLMTLIKVMRITLKK